MKRIVTYQGEEMTIRALATKTGVPYPLLYNRIVRENRTPDVAVAMGGGGRKGSAPKKGLVPR